MAHAAWLSKSPSSGTGNGIVAVSSIYPHTGRIQRTTQLTFSASGVSDQIVTVNQSAIGDVTTIDIPETIPGDGGTIYVTGTSNSTELNISLLDNKFSLNDLEISIDSGVLWLASTPGSAIMGDPGADNVYKWRIQVSANFNNSIQAITDIIEVTPAEGLPVSEEIIQGGLTSLLFLSPYQAYFGGGNPYWASITVNRYDSNRDYEILWNDGGDLKDLSEIPGQPFYISSKNPAAFIINAEENTGQFGSSYTLTVRMIDNNTTANLYVYYI